MEKNKPKDLVYSEKFPHGMYVRHDGVRIKIKPNGKAQRLCIANDNTCEKDGKQIFCNGHKNGTCRTAEEHKVEGLISRDENGRRFKWIGGQKRPLCIGDDDTCMSIAKSNFMCDGHIVGNKKYSTKDYVKGDRKITEDGAKKVFNGIQWVIICKYENCDIPRTNGGYCKKHCPHWHCKFTEAVCTSIRVNNTDYCRIHRDNKLHQREKSAGEVKISQWLIGKNINFVCNKIQYYNDTTLYPDFILGDHNAIIEYDGKQHFEIVEYWGGEEGLQDRIVADKNKDNWALRNGYHMLRIPHTHDDIIDIVLNDFFEYIKLYGSPTIFAPDCPLYNDRDYMLM